MNFLYFFEASDGTSTHTIEKSLLFSYILREEYSLGSILSAYCII